MGFIKKVQMTNQDGKHIIEPESLVQIFLRLNGFLALSHAVVHREVEYTYKVSASATIIGLRFPYGREGLAPMFSSDARLTDLELPFLLLGEMQEELCGFGKNWLSPNGPRLKRIVVGTGLFPTEQLEGVVTDLRTKGWYQDRYCMVQSVCFGAAVNPELNMPEVIQITWDDLFKYAFDCFQVHGKNKMNHPQWEQIGQKVWQVALQTPVYETFRGQFVVEKWRVFPTEQAAETTKPDAEGQYASVEIAKPKPKPKIPYQAVSRQGDKDPLKKQPIPRPYNRDSKPEVIHELFLRINAGPKSLRPKSVNAFLAICKSQMKTELIKSDLVHFLSQCKEPPIEILDEDVIQFLQYPT